MNRFTKLVTALATIVVLGTGCTRITTGEIGVRVNASKEVQGTELMPGSWNQTVIGDVLTFPTKDISITLENKTPMTSDNSALADFDITVVYGINPTSVSELYTTKSKSFHAYDEKERDTYLMYNYIQTLVNNASYKVVRGYESLKVADNRALIEQQIRETVTEQLKAEKLDTSIVLSVVQIRNILPNAEILASATAFVRAQNDLKIKETEVAIAKKESERMAALSSNSAASIAYMQAQANLTVANAIAAGKVNTILMPHGMTMLGSIK
jgi:regulator of protease activity HflC (stomatin/prohibitin superfamily)